MKELELQLKRIADILELNELRKQKVEQALIERDERSMKAIEEERKEMMAANFLDPKKVPYNRI